MAENQVLRGLLKSLSSFIGEGAGGLLSKMGWEMADFNDLVNKAETDSAWESYQRHKREKSETAGPSGASSSNSKRPADDADPYGLRPKRARQSDTNGDARGGDGFPLLVPLNPAVSSMGPNGLYSSGRPQDGGLLPEYARGSSSSSPMFVPPSSPPNQTGSQFGSSSGGGMPMAFQSSFVPGMSMTGDHMSTMTMVTNVSSMSNAARTPQTSAQQASEEDDDPKKMDAYKLIQYVVFTLARSKTCRHRRISYSYHLDNWKRNNNYCLPSSLRPTLVQR